jgi:hypothetical protein
LIAADVLPVLGWRALYLESDRFEIVAKPARYLISREARRTAPPARKYEQRFLMGAGARRIVEHAPDRWAVIGAAKAALWRN